MLSKIDYMPAYIYIDQTLIRESAIKRMYPYVKCPTCACLIGHVYRLFQEMRTIKNASNESEKDMIDIFKLLGITNYCCKTRLMASRQFNDFLRE